MLLDRRVTIVDTGLPGSAGRLLRALESAGRRPDEVERVVITHYHPDHIGGLAELQSMLPARAAIHSIEAPAVMSAMGPPSPINMRYVRNASSRFTRPLFRHSPVRIDEWLHDGDEFPVLGGMRVVHTPGHTPGHIALYFPDMALLIAGDSMEHRGGVLSGPAPVFTQDMDEAIRSLGRLADLEIDVIAFSHFARLPIDAGARLREFVNYSGLSASSASRKPG